MTVVTRKVAVKPRQDVMRHGDVPGVAHLMLDGYACRYRLLGDGRRQITALLMPGDLCDLDAVMRGRADYAVASLTICTMGEIPADHIAAAEKGDPVLRRILWRQLLRDEAIAREWMVVLGRRTARERVAHLLCEIGERLRAVGLGRDGTYELGLTQMELADALGLSVVHVNRIVQDLRHSGLIEFEKKRLRIVDLPALVETAGFDHAYLDIR